MGIAFKSNSVGNCCLCGSDANLTGEHKVKATVLRADHEERKVLFGASTSSRRKIIQSSKSKGMHFRKKICLACNSEFTQQADLAFDWFHFQLREAIRHGRSFELSRNALVATMGAEKHLNFFRYFAKILCMYWAETGGPRPIQIAEFAIGLSDFNPVLLEISRDKEYSPSSTTNTRTGGFRMWFDRSGTFVTSAESELFCSGINYYFGASLNLAASQELETEFSDYFRSARDSAIARS